MIAFISILCCVQSINFIQYHISVNSLVLAGKPPARSAEPALRGKEAFREAIAGVRTQLNQDSASAIEDLTRLRAKMLELMAKAEVQTPVYDYGALSKKELAGVAKRELVFPSGQVDVSLLAGEPYHIVDARINTLNVLGQSLPGDLAFYEFALCLSSPDPTTNHQLPERPRLWQYETIRTPAMDASLALVMSMGIAVVYGSPFWMLPVLLGASLATFGYMLRLEFKSRLRLFQPVYDMAVQFNAANEEAERMKSELQNIFLEKLNELSLNVFNLIRHCSQGVKEALVSLKGSP